MRKIFLLFLGIFFLCTGIVQASNITIDDKNSSSTTGWYGQQEDNEVEPGMIANQSWDLEGFFLNKISNKYMLSLVGGYDFKNGNSGYTSGDIFIDINGNAVYGDIHGPQAQNDNLPVLNNYGYDYVLDLNWTGMTYDVYKIDNTSMVQTAYYIQNQGSSPWQYVSGGRKISGGTPLAYNTTASAYDAIFSGGIGSHRELTVDLNFLLTENPGLDHINFIAHYTMGCGNDNIMGQGTIPNPEPATLLLLGFGLLGVAGLGRKKLS